MVQSVPHRRAAPNRQLIRSFFWADPLKIRPLSISKASKIKKEKQQQHANEGMCRTVMFSTTVQIETLILVHCFFFFYFPWQWDTSVLAHLKPRHAGVGYLLQTREDLSLRLLGVKDHCSTATTTTCTATLLHVRWSINWVEQFE